MNFADRVIDKVREKRSVVVVGLDPRFEKLPCSIVSEAFERFGSGAKGIASAFWLFNRAVIDAVEPYCVAVKPQFAFYEPLGSHGMLALQKTIAYARKRGLLVINDAKRGDIGTTAQAYASAHLGHPRLVEGMRRSSLSGDAVTVNAYLGIDGVLPFIEASEARGGGIFILVKTSNPSAGDFQDLRLQSGEAVYEALARLVSKWGEPHIGRNGYSCVGAVVAGTYPDIAARLRELMPHSIFLVPGFGAQGASPADVVRAFGKDGLGALVASSRGITFPSDDASLALIAEGRFSVAVARAAERMRSRVNEALEQAGKSLCPLG